MMKKHNDTPMKNHFLSYFIFAAIVTMTSCLPQNEDAIQIEASEQSPIEGDYKLSATQFQSSGMKLGKLENERISPGGKG